MAARIIKKVVKMRFSASYSDGIQVFVQMRKDIESLARKYPRYKSFIKREIRSLDSLLPIVCGIGLECAHLLTSCEAFRF
jgi:hypothetical protein